MAEIDTTAPFASVRDAIYMFGEHSNEKIQRAFLSTHDLQLEVEFFEIYWNIEMFHNCYCLCKYHIIK